MLLYRLDQVNIEPGLPRFAAIRLLAPAGCGHQQDIVPSGHLPDVSRDIVAIHVGHADIQYHHVRHRRSDGLQRGQASIDALRFTSAEFDDLADAPQNVRIIVRQQHFQFGRRFYQLDRG